MLFEVVFKDERPTSNIQVSEDSDIERRIMIALRSLNYFKIEQKNQCRILSDYFRFFSAVLILVTKILFNSSVSCIISSNSSGFLISGSLCWVSLSSFNEIRSLWIKSFGDSAA